MTRSPRKTLPDIIRENPSPFATPVDTFAEAYPDVDTFTLTIVEKPEKRETFGQTHHIGPGAWKSSVPCHNLHCYGGGFEVGVFLHLLTHNRVEHEKDVKICEGHEGTKTKRRRECVTMFGYEIDITYKPTASGSPQSPPGP